MVLVVARRDVLLTVPPVGAPIELAQGFVTLCYFIGEYRLGFTEQRIVGLDLAEAVERKQIADLDDHVGVVLLHISPHPSEATLSQRRTVMRVEDHDDVISLAPVVAGLADREP